MNIASILKGTLNLELCQSSGILTLCHPPQFMKPNLAIRDVGWTAVSMHFFYRHCSVPKGTAWVSPKGIK